MAFRDHHSRAATPEYKRACDEMGWDAGLTMSRYLVEGREDESFGEWKARTLANLRDAFAQAGHV